jgi:hypothetical protein
MSAVGNSTAPITGISGHVSRFDIGSSDYPDDIVFVITDAQQVDHQGCMFYGTNNPASANYAMIFTTAMMNGYPVTVFNSGEKRDGIDIYRGITLSWPGAST